MTRTLSQLRDEIDALIKAQGKDAPVAAFVFTNEDVFDLNDEQEPQFLPIDDATQVLKNVDENQYFYDEVYSMIKEEVFFIKNK